MNPNITRLALVEKISDRLHAEGYKGYISLHLGEALEVARNGGSILDLDRIIILKDILGFNVSYNLFTMIDAQYNDVDLLEFTEDDKAELMELVNRITF